METKKIPTHVVNLKESKTHLFYVIQSDNEHHDNAQRLVQLRISKDHPRRKLVSHKIKLRDNANNNVTEENRQKSKRMQIPTRLASIHKRTDHPSFVVLPEVLSEKLLKVRRSVEANQSTSENSNETYVIRSKNDTRASGSLGKMPTLFNSVWKRNSESNKQTDDFCECDNDTANKSRKLNNKVETVDPAQNTSPLTLGKETISDDLFNINYFVPIQNGTPQRLRAGQDYDRRYKSCHMCPNMTRIFPPASARRPTGLHSNNGSDSTLDNRGGFVKINLKLVRQCLINGSASEKTAILDAIRMRMKSSDFNGAISTIEDIVKFDLFGVQCECRSKPILEDLFWPLTPSHQLQTSIAQFVNAMVSYKLGRSYFNSRSIIGMLTWGDIGRDNIDRIMGDNLMGIMMKLSGSRFQRKDMLKNGLIPWLLQHMQEEEYSASKYHLQCMVGLLRNLLRGFNLENFSSTETDKLIVLLGRYLEHEDGIAKRYVCDSLIVLFQSTNCVTSAKELNFQRVIQEHANNATDPAQKEHLGGIYRLLNRSSTSNNTKTTNFRPDEEPFLDANLEPGSEVDSYAGECLIRGKFTGDGDTQDKAPDEFIATDKSLKRDKLVTRVFVEHLNSFLPNIDNNRIFPLCNNRCADKIRTCSHVGDIQQKSRKPYIPPNSRLPRQQQSMEDSIAGTSNVDYNKTMMKHLKSRPSGEESVNVRRLVSRVSTISHDESAAKWDHIGKKHGEDRSFTPTSKDGSAMEKIFDGRSKRAANTLEGDRSISGGQDSYEWAKNDGNATDDRRRDDQSSHTREGVNENRRTKNDGNATDDRRRDDQSPHTREGVNENRRTKNDGNAIDDRRWDGQSPHTREGTNENRRAKNDGNATDDRRWDGQSPHTREGTNENRRAKNDGNAIDDRRRDDQSPHTREETNKKTTQQNLDSKGVNVDKDGRREWSPSRSSDANDGFRRALDSKQKIALEEARLKESLATRGIERDETTRMNDETMTQQANFERNQTRRGDNEPGRGVYGHEETLTNLDRDKQMSHMTKGTENLDNKKVGYQSVRSKETLTETKTGQRLLLNVRSERVVKKTTTGNVKTDGQETGVRLKVRSEENLTDLESGKPGVTLQARSELFSVKTGTGNENKKLKPVRSEKMVSNKMDVRANEIGNKLNVRSENLVLKRRERGGESPSSLKEARTATPNLHARSMEMLKDSTDVLESHQPLRKSKSNVLNAKEIHFSPRTPPTSQPRTSAKPQNIPGREYHARSMEYQGTTLFKSSSEELLGSTKNQDFSLEPVGVDRTKLANQFAVRSTEFVGRTQSAIFKGQKDSRRRIQVSKHCVDCTGSGYVLRERPSQPCDRCAVSLTKYPDFVDALATQDYHRRDVTRTNGEWIKTDLSSKTDGKLSTKPSKASPNKEKLGKSKIDKMSEKMKRNADGTVGKSSYLKGEKPKFDKKAKQNTTWNEDVDAKHSTVTNETTSGGEVMAKKILHDLTTDGPRDIEDEPVTNKASGEIEKQMPFISIQEQSLVSTENVSSSTSQSVNTGDEARSSTIQPPVSEATQTQSMVNEDVLGERSQLTTNVNIEEHLPFSPLTENTTSTNLISDHEPVETNVNFGNDFHLISKATKMHQALTDESSPMNESNPPISKSSKQGHEKDELIGSNQGGTAIHKSDDTERGKRDAEIDSYQEVSEKLSATPSTQKAEHKSDDSNSCSRDVDIEIDFETRNSKNLDVVQTIQEAPDVQASGNENDISRSVEEEEVAVNDQRDETIPDSVIPLKESTGVTNLMATTNERVVNVRLDPYFSIDFSRAIGQTILSSQRIVNEATTSNRTTNVSPNVVSTSNDKEIREAISDPQISEKQPNLPVALHLFPRSNEFVEVRTKAVDIEEGTNALGESENATKHLTGQATDTTTVSFKEKTERSDESTEKIALKDQPSSSDNTKLSNSRDESCNNVSVPRLDQENLNAMQMSHLSEIQENRNSYNVTAVVATSIEAITGAYSESPDNQLSKLMNREMKSPEATVAPPSELLELPSESSDIVSSNIASAPQDNKIPISEPLSSECLNKVAEVTEGSMLPTVTNENFTEALALHNIQDQSLLQQQGQNRKQHTVVAIPLVLRRVENMDRETKEFSLISPRTNVTTPAKDQQQHETKIEQQIENICAKKQGVVAEYGNDKESIEISFKKPIDNKSSVVLDEVFVEERHLQSDEQTAYPSDDIDREYNLDGIGYFSDGNIEMDRRKIKVVNSTCCKRLLNNDELINRLSEKVLEKLLSSKIHQCGPNCNSPCGRFNSLLNAKTDNNLNWQ